MLVSRLLVASLITLATLLALPEPSHAGIVNVQSALATEAEEGLAGSVTGSADYRTGNIDLLLLSIAPVARFRAGKHLVIGIAKAEFGKTGDPLTTFIKRTFAHTRYRYRINDRVTGEAFAQHSFDDFLRLSTRALIGVGPKLNILDQKKLGVDVGVAYMLEYERLSENPTATDSGEDDLAHRASSYLTLRVEIDDRLQFVETAYVQPRLSDVGDVRLLNEATLSVKLTDRFSFSTSFVIAHDQEPPETVEKTDTSLKSSVTVSF